MGAGPSKERMLYDCVRKGNIHLIRNLHSKGASPNWMSSSGKTPLILACAAADRLPVAETLIELGADVNYYDPESAVGTALQRAADRGLEQTANLLLSVGANPLLCDVYGQNALDFARERGHTAIVRAIEKKICFFSGWLRDTSSARMWAVVLPSDDRISKNVPEMLKIALYRDRQSPSPFDIVSLSKYYVQKPIVSLDPELVFTKKSSGKKLMFLSGVEGDNEQSRLLYDTCRGKTKKWGFVSSYQPISDPADSEIQALAKFAVRQHRKDSGERLFLTRVLGGQLKYNKGTNYRLVIGAIGRHRVENLYLALVSKMPWWRLELTAFNVIV